MRRNSFNMVDGQCSETRSAIPVSSAPECFGTIWAGIHTGVLRFWPSFRRMTRFRGSVARCSLYPLPSPLPKRVPEAGRGQGEAGRADHYAAEREDKPLLDD